MGMFDLTMLDLSRLQFAFTAAFHMVFPAVTVGLSLFLVVVYGLYMRTDNPAYRSIYRFFRNLFAIGFGLGIVSGIMLTFQFGLNWGPFANATGPIVGTLLALEVVTAFFLEAAFLGIMIYGEGRFSRKIVMFATAMVALGAFLSTTWIMSSNSWMQTPAGFEMLNGQFVPVDWLAVIFNPAFPLRYVHMVVATILSSALLVTGVGAWYLIRGTHTEFARRTFSLGLGFLAIFAPLELYTGDALGQDVISQYQPAKLAAMEGNWDSSNTGWNLLVIPDRDAEENIVQFGVPFVGSLIVNHDFALSEPVGGMSEFSDNELPPITWTFYGFRIMLASAGAIVVLAAISVVLRVRGQLYTARWFHWLSMFAIPAGVIGIVAGWITSEVGRQPWVVYGELATSDTVSNLAPGSLIFSVALILGVYAALFGAYVYYLVRAMKAGPEDASNGDDEPDFDVDDTDDDGGGSDLEVPGEREEREYAGAGHGTGYGRHEAAGRAYFRLDAGRTVG
ncbi:MAG: cytochrome ubiquinol oxidase subunit I [Rubrobacter sp.]